MMTRHLRWESCYNIRDLGGCPTGDGGQTRWGAIVRADTLSRLTPAGRAALLDYGVRTIIDLRRAEELALDPSPFASPGEHAGQVEYHNLPLGAGAARSGIAAVQAAEERDDFSLPALYRTVLDRYGRGIATIMTMIARAPEGAVLFHCHAGKDRTGLIAALLLALAGVPYPTIAEDYALTQVCLRPIYDERLSQEHDPARRKRLVHQLGATPETMLAILAHLDMEYGGVERFLIAAGLMPEELERLRRRIRG